jgi:hypothetical protein
LTQWLLILADRINSAEGIADDLRHGHVPNIFAERGWNAAWKYDRKNVIKRVAIGAVVTTAVVAYFIVRKTKSKK